MRIVHVLHSMAVAGAEVLVHDFVNRTHAGLTQSVVTLDAMGALGDALRAQSIDVECLHRIPGFDAGLPFRLAQSFRRTRAEVIHAHQYTPYFYSALAALMVRPRPVLIFTEHGRHVPDVRRPKRVAFNTLSLAWTDRVTAVCAYVKRLLVANEGIAAGRVEVIYNGVDASRFNREIDGGGVRRELGIGDDERVVTCVARFHPVKDHASLIKGFARASAHIPKARLLLVGGGDREPELRNLVDELRITSNVTFAGVRKDIPEVLAASDLFAMTSLSEGTSVTLLEAMLSRRAAVVTNVGGNPEIVDQGRTGLLVPSGDTVATGDAMARILGNEGLRESLGDAGRARVLANFTQDRMHRAWANLYTDSVAARATASRSD